jgi:hypothetical protein
MNTLCVYVAGHCPTFAYSAELAREAAATFPDIDVRLVQVDRSDQSTLLALGEVPLTPSYYLNGRPISWGNPDRDELFRILHDTTHSAVPGDDA